MTSSSFVIALRECTRPLPAANIVNLASAAAPARTAFRLIRRLPALQSLSSPLAAARRAFTPRGCASFIRAVADRGRRYINSSPCLRRWRFGRSLLRQLVAVSRAVPSASLQLAMAQCAFIPYACALIVGGDGGHPYNRPCLRHPRSGRTLQRQRCSECEPRGHVTDLRPNPAFNADVPWAALRAGPRPAG